MIFLSNMSSKSLMVSVNSQHECCLQEGSRQLPESITGHETPSPREHSYLNLKSGLSEDVEIKEINLRRCPDRGIFLYVQNNTNGSLNSMFCMEKRKFLMNLNIISYKFSGN